MIVSDYLGFSHIKQRGGKWLFLWAEDTDCTEYFQLSRYCTVFQYSLLLLQGILIKVCMDDTMSERHSLSTLKDTEEV